MNLMLILICWYNNMRCEFKQNRAKRRLLQTSILKNTRKQVVLKIHGWMY
jgi:hypothetical protein